MKKSQSPWAKYANTPRHTAPPQNEQLTDELQRLMEATLPAYMVPSLLIQLPSMPLTANGKVDRKALPVPEIKRTVNDPRPMTPTEELLTTVWIELLKLTHVGRNDNFFDLGGQSLLATQLVARIRDLFQVEFPVRSVFSYPELSSMASNLDMAQHTNSLPPITVQSKQARRQPSFAQQRLWFLDQFEEQGIASYNMPGAWWLSGKLDMEALEKSLHWLLERHHTLRSCFHTQDGEGVVEVCDIRGTTLLQQQDLTYLQDDALQHEISNQIHQHSMISFDLQHDLPISFKLLHIAPEQSLLMLNMHHIVSDGWSVDILLRDLQLSYCAFAKDEQPNVSSLAIQYSDFSVWQRQWLQGEVLQQQLDYWQQQLEGIPELLELPTDTMRPAQPSYHGGRYDYSLSDTLSQSLIQLSQQQRVTTFMTMLATFAILLARYSRQQDVCIGSPIANRTHSSSENIIGLFVNTLVLRSQIEPEQSFVELLRTTRENCLGAYAHQDIPFEVLVEQLQPYRNMSHNPLFQVMFAFQTPLPDLELSNLKTELYPVDYPISKFDLTLFAKEDEGKIHCSWEYATDLFSKDTVVRMNEHFMTLLSNIVDQPHQSIAQLNMLSNQEYQQQQSWNQTAGKIPECTLITQFEQQAANTPENIAIIFEEQSFTYAQVNQQANQLAHHLLSINLVQEQNPLIAVIQQRSPEMIIHLLAVLKAGMAYVPIDPDYPTERIQQILAHSGTLCLITHRKLYQQLQLEQQCIAVFPDELALSDYAMKNTDINIHPDDIAYVIFTSGSTGQPKGVVISHRSAMNTIDDMNERFAVCESDSVLALSSLSFDLSVYDIFGLLSVGGTVVVPHPQFVKEPSYWAKMMLKHRISLWNTVPALMQIYVDYINDQTALIPEDLRLVLMSGDWIPTTLPTGIKKLCPQAQVISLGGATEASIWSIYFPIDAVNVAWKSIPYGKPLRNQYFHVLDNALNLCPVQVPGHLFIGGIGLAQGYWRDAERTNASFIIHPKTGERLYKTGDIGRYLTDGNIEFLGRDDFQIKINGFRIELGDIETTLCQHPATEDTLVTLHGTGDHKFLVAYVTGIRYQGSGGRDQNSVIGELHDWLRTRLPEYMLPKHIMLLNAFPLTANGKIDRKVLPAPQSNKHEGTRPFTPNEDLLATAWAKLLQLTDIKREDNFFRLGGNSLLAMQLVARVRELFHIELPVRAVFEYPVLAHMALEIEKSRHHVLLPAITKQEHDADQLLSFSQQRLWFLDQLEGSNNATYNIHISLKLSGPLDVNTLRQSLMLMIERHHSLRTHFTVHGCQPMPQVTAMSEMTDVVKLQNLTHLPMETRSDEMLKQINAHAIAPFDLTHDHLFRVQCVLMDANTSLLLFNMHHIISDGVSMMVLLQEWAQCYRAFSEGEQPVLPVLEIEYRDYAAWQKNWLQGEVLQQQVDYWKKQLDGIPDVIGLPTDRPRSNERKYDGKTVFYPLDDTLSGQLNALAQAHETTTFMTLFAVFSLLLARYSGEDDLCVGTPIANRGQKQTENIVGFFVNTLVLRTNFAALLGEKDHITFVDLIKYTRQTCLSAYTHQDIPFDTLVEQLQPTRSMRHSPLFQVMFSLEHDEISQLTVPELDISVMDAEYPIAKFDLTLTMEVGKRGNLSCWWEYATDIFDQATIAGMAEHFEVLLQAVVENPQMDIRAIPLITKEESRKIQQWNDTSSSYSPHETLADLFEAQVARTPDRIAVELPLTNATTTTLSYQQLNNQANRVAHHLIKQGVKANTLVGIWVERSPEMLVAMLAVLKTGAAYLPLHPDYPVERLHFMLEDSGSSILLTQGHLDVQPSQLVQVTIIDMNQLQGVNNQLLMNPERHNRPDDLAYVIYTSGSTGKPKGVCVEHAPIAKHCRYMQAYYQLNKHDHALQFLSINFDPSIEQIFSPWLVGARIILLKDNLMTPMALMQLLHQTAATVVDIPAAYWQQMCDLSDVTSKLTKMRLLILAGEVLPLPLAQQTQRLFPALTIINEYGPTEAVIASSLYTLQNPLPDDYTSVPIGQPTADSKLYILNAHHQIQPLGAAGELCIAGDSLARGYMNRPALTQQQFVELPLFGTMQRVYKTGDLARWLPDGNIEYMGRVDQQIKLRGFRVELGEIEAILSQHQAINEAVVLLRQQDEDQQLIAYLTLNQTVENHTLRDWLNQKLPNYMVPAAFHTVATMPIAASGKIDRKALAALTVNIGSQTKKTLARDVIELQLLTIWQTVLKQNVLGIHDNFFDLGGHSLLALTLMGKIQQQFDTKISISSLFMFPTIASLAEQLRGNKDADDVSCIIPLQSTTEGSEGTVLMLPEATGSVMYLYPLAASLGNQSAVYALQSPGLDACSEAIEEVKDLAQFHFNHLREQHINGPYTLIGHSSGGRLAYELAWLMEQAGEVVEVLAILDTYAPNSPPEYDSMDDYNDYNWLHDIVYAFETANQTQLNTSMHELELRGDIEKAYHYVLELFRRHHIFAPNTPMEELKAMVNVYKLTCLGDRAYQMPGTLHCPIHLFCASESTSGIGGLDNPELVTQGWSSCTDADVVEHWVAGNHMSMVFSPQVETLAEKISACFKEVLK